MSSADLVQRTARHFVVMYGVDLEEQGGELGVTASRLM